ncbi:preprotein translocase subunit SecE [Conexibacter sp. W3-3-2]|uniref:Protein translocase subunit SecE n=1 Tax=Paraconexibacter algicola TaxID=2133960 RepID=A0A2T4UBM2_9ACTN|nr:MULTISPECIES: preprotein translocase subunit SecE [Solirubrobacterales]MTD44353.1 preprotein translocase subunit SecE [Conexibacter sp. W3-3-2]PTL54285.1 preprotein translocase subunit SecE [Paraconexibacter algicola]
MARDDEHEQEQDAPDERELEQQALAAAPSGAPREQSLPGQSTKGGPARFGRFLKASWAELQRVQWPDRRQVGQATAVVLGFVVVAGAYLGLADVAAENLVDLVL